MKTRQYLPWMIAGIAFIALVALRTSGGDEGVESSADEQHA